MFLVTWLGWSEGFIQVEKCIRWIRINIHFQWSVLSFLDVSAFAQDGQQCMVDVDVTKNEMVIF